MSRFTHLITLFVLAAPAALPAATLVLTEQTGIAVPAGRGGANSTYFGWDTFTGTAGDAGFPNTTGAINDPSPEIGTNPGGALIVTTNAQDHISGSGNYYSFTGTVGERITAPAAGIVGQGFTSIIVQFLSAPGFGAINPVVDFGTINGVSPVVAQGLNGAGLGHLWAKWDVPGNQASYQIDFTSAGPDSHVSIDKLVVDTFWSATGFQGDTMAVPEPSLLGLTGLGLLAARRRRL